KTPYSFDASIWEFYAPLLSGAQLVMAVPNGHQDMGYLTGVITEQGITVVQAVPSLLKALLNESRFKECESLTRVCVGGEALTAGLLETFFGTLDAELINLYGPTETTVETTFWSGRGTCNKSNVSIGHPISNTQVYILDGRSS